MALPVYLAMTPWEFHNSSNLPEHCGWLGCHFSLHTKGLSNFPQQLPAGSLLVLDDQTPPDGHDPHLVTAQLIQLVERFSLKGILLDFQRPTNTQTVNMAKHILSTLPCPVAAPPGYSSEKNHAVFLPPVPAHIAVPKYLSPWLGRDIWLETELGVTDLSLTGDGCVVSVGYQATGMPAFHDPQLHCHYNISLKNQAAIFSLYRTKEDTSALIEEAMQYGVKLVVGLFQEWGT